MPALKIAWLLIPIPILRKSIMGLFFTIKKLYIFAHYWSMPYYRQYHKLFNWLWVNWYCYSWIEINTLIKAFQYDFFLPLRRGIPDMQRPSYVIPMVADGLTLIPTMISNHIHYKIWDEITNPVANFNDVAIEVWEWISNFVPYFTGHAITYPCWDLD